MFWAKWHDKKAKIHMSHTIDQEMEKEAIRAIYPEEFIDIAPNEYIFQLPVPGIDGASIKLHIQYPPEYPDVPVNIRSCEALKLHQPISSKIILAINTRHTELVGEPYIVALSTLIEDAMGIQADDVELDSLSPAVSNLPDEGEFNPGLLPGPPLTVENFNEWWTTFCMENNIVLEEDGHCTRPTGRQIWEEMEKGGTSATMV